VDRQIILALKRSNVVRTTNAKMIKTLAILTAIRIMGVGNTTATQPKMINMIRPMVDRMRVIGLGLNPRRDLAFRRIESFCRFNTATNCAAPSNAFLHLWRSRNTVDLPVLDPFAVDNEGEMESSKVLIDFGELLR
jgi:hypothetical protein